MPFAPVGGTMCAASPARNSLPACIGVETKLRMPTMFFWKIRPSVICQPSSVSTRAWSSDQMRSSDQASTESFGSHWKYMRRRRRFDQNPEPAKRIDALIVVPHCLGHRPACDPLRPVATDDEVALQFVLEPFVP